MLICLNDTFVYFMNGPTIMAQSNSIHLFDSLESDVFWITLYLLITNYFRSSYFVQRTSVLFIFHSYSGVIQKIGLSKNFTWNASCILCSRFFYHSLKCHPRLQYITKVKQCVTAVYVVSKHFGIFLQESTTVIVQ